MIFALLMNDIKRSPWFSINLKRLLINLFMGLLLPSSHGQQLERLNYSSLALAHSCTLSSFVIPSYSNNWCIDREANFPTDWTPVAGLLPAENHGVHFTDLVKMKAESTFPETKVTQTVRDPAETLTVARATFAMVWIRPCTNTLILGHFVW